MPHYQNVPFEVPSSWVWCKLEDYVKSVTDGDHQAPPKSDIGIPFLVISDVAKGKLNFLNTRFVPQEYYEKISFDRKPEKGDLLFTVTGSYGIVVPVNIDCKFCFQRHIGLIKTLNTSEYLLHLLKSSYFKGQCDEFATGTAQKTVGLETLRSFLLPIPPFAEQQRIVIEIEKWFSLIELIEGGKDDLQTTIKQAKSKILDLAIHGKLVPQDPNEEPAIKLLKRINPDFTPCDNGHYPVGWIETILGELFSHNTGKALNSSNKEGIFKDYLTTSNVYWNKFDFTAIKQMPFKESELNKCTVTKGDLLVCEGGDIGRSAIWNYDYDICIQNHIHRLRPKIDLCVPFYYYTFAYLKENNLIGGKGIGLLGLSSNALHKIEMPLPPLAEQQRIVQKIEELFSVLDNIQNALEV